MKKLIAGVKSILESRESKKNPVRIFFTLQNKQRRYTAECKAMIRLITGELGKKEWKVGRKSLRDFRPGRTHG